MPLRNVITTNGTRKVDEEYADRVEEILANIAKVGHPGRVLRETYREEHGLRTWQARMVSYPAPGTGEETCAATYEDGASWEVEEGTRDEVEARYEEFVRSTDEATRTSGDSENRRAWFDFTDVPGVLTIEGPDGYNPEAVTVGYNPYGDRLADWLAMADHHNVEVEHVGYDDDGDPLVRTADGQFYALVNTFELKVVPVPVAAVRVTP